MDSESGPATEPPKVSVRLASSIDETVGLNVTDQIRRARFEYLHVQEPSEMTIEYGFKDKKRVTVNVRMSSIAVRNGRVSSVDLLPLMEARPYDEVIVAMQKYIREFGITPDARMWGHLAKWPYAGTGDVTGYTARYRAGMSLGDDVAFDVEVRSAQGGGWFLVVTFAMEGETARRMAGVTTEPSSAPGGP